jgi:hypothetical protein
MIQNGLAGLVLKLQFVDINDDPIDISAASNKEIIFKKPSGGLLVATATFTTDGSDGVIQYIITEGDIDEPGDWYIQGKVDTSPILVYYTENLKIRVVNNLSGS